MIRILTRFLFVAIAFAITTTTSLAQEITTDFPLQTERSADGVEYTVKSADGNVSLNCSKGQYNKSHYRFHTSSKVTISVDGLITKIVFTAVSSTYTPKNLSTTVGAYTATSTVDTWTGSESSVTFNVKSAVRMTGIRVTYEKSAPKESAALEFTPSSVEYEQSSGTFTSPTFTKATTATVDFTSSDETIATVSADGVITLAGGIGTATITAKSDANDAYLAGEATCTVTVKAAKQPAALEFIPSAVEYEQGSGAFTSPTFTKSTTATVDFTSSNEAIATVSADGVITLAGGIGTAIITAKSDANDAYLAGEATCTVTVKAAKQPAALEFTPSSVEYEQSSGTFTSPTFTKATTAAVDFTSSDETIATVSADGVITLAGGIGTATITAKSDANDAYLAGEATCTVTVKAAKLPAALEFTPSTVEYEQSSGDFTSPTFTKSTTATVDFTSSDETIATVSADGVITLAGGIGTATITAKSDANDAYLAGEATCTVTVTAKPTGIRTTELKTDGQPYNLFGQRVNESYRGIVIRNGKKVLVK